MVVTAQTGTIEVLSDFAEPTAVASTINDLDCFIEVANISGDGSSNGVTFTYEWSGNGAIMNADNIDATVLESGSFTLMVTFTRSRSLGKGSNSFEFVQDRLVAEVFV